MNVTACVLPTQSRIAIVSYMSTVRDLENAVIQLEPEQYAAFRKWFEEYESDLWDSQIEADALSGKLDTLAQEAEAEFEAGKSSRL